MAGDGVPSRRDRCRPRGSSEEAERNLDEQGQAMHDEEWYRGSAERTEGYFTGK